MTEKKNVPDPPPLPNIFCVDAISCGEDIRNGLEPSNPFSSMSLKKLKKIFYALLRINFR